MPAGCGDGASSSGGIRQGNPGVWVRFLSGGRGGRHEIITAPAKPSGVRNAACDAGFGAMDTRARHPCAARFRVYRRYRFQGSPHAPEGAFGVAVMVVRCGGVQPVCVRHAGRLRPCPDPAGGGAVVVCVLRCAASAWHGPGAGGIPEVPVPGCFRCGSIVCRYVCHGCELWISGCGP